MSPQTVGRAVRALRLRNGWRQVDLARRARVSREVVSRIERGLGASTSIRVIERVALALDATLAVELRWHGAELERLMDRAHAALQELVVELLRRAGWQVRVEVSFNYFGERGRVDVLAWHPGKGILVVGEVKSALGDLQETFGRLDVKVRLGRRIAASVGWSTTHVVRLLVLRESGAARRVVTKHPELFADLPLRGRHAAAWLQAPTPDERGMLLWMESPRA